MINKNITPISEIAYLNTGLLLLGQLNKSIRVDIHECSLTDVQGMIYHFGGSIDLYNKKIAEVENLTFGTFKITIGLLQIVCYMTMTVLSYQQQLAAFGSNVFVFEKGTEVTVIDNSYFVF